MSAIVAALVIPCFVLAGAARADDASEADKLREQLRSTVMQLRELQDQQAAAKSASSPSVVLATPDVTALKAKLAAVQARLRAAERESTDAKADADKTRADLAAIQATNAATQAELEKFKAAFSQVVDQNRTLTAERDQLKALLSTQTAISQACDAKNQRLTTFAEGLLDRYNHVTLGEKLIAREPVFGFDRVHLENIAQEREDTIRGDHCDPRLDASPQKTGTK